LGSVDEPAVRARPDVWAQGRIKAMMDQATPEQRKPLEAVIAGKWDEVKASGDLEKLRHFVGMFGSTAAIGKEGRLYLAERLAEREGRADLSDAENQFLMLTNDDDPAFVARAYDGLARLMTRKGLLEDAFKYYRDLKVHFPETPVRDGKTGTQLFEDLACDKRFLQYMDEPGADLVGKRFKAVEERDKNFQPTSQHSVFTFEALNEALPYLKHYRFGVNPGNNKLVLMDRLTSKDELNEAVNEPFQQFMYPQHMMMPNPAMGMVVNPNQQIATNRFGYHSVGHVLVANLGQWLVGVDVVRHKQLWAKNLLGDYGPGSSSLMYNAAEETLQVLFPDGTMMTCAQSGPVEPTYVCYQTREGLWALDPLTGKVLWTRSDLSTRCRLFGDSRHVYLVELDNAGTATTTRAFRAQDGVSVPVPNFAGLYQKRERIVGRQMLVKDGAPGGGLALRLYDVQTGKDLWSQTFPANTIMLRSEDPDLAGAVSPDGHVTVVSLSRRKVVVVGYMDPAHLKNQKELHLLADAQLVYVMPNVTDPANPNDQVWANLQPNTGLRGITVNGEMYAFSRRTSKIAWHMAVKNQQLSLEQWKEMPVLLFTARFQQGGNMVWRGGFPNNQVFGDIYIEAYDKRTGKLFEKVPTTGHPPMGQNYGQIYAINNDVLGGKIEMIANNYKITIAPEGEASAKDDAKEKGTKPAAQGGASAGDLLPRSAPGEKIEVIRK
jgi:hypothetical protein